MSDLFKLLQHSLEGRPILDEINQEEFIDCVMQAADVASEGRGFLMISVGIDAFEGKLAYFPTIVSVCSNDDVATIIESEILQLAAMSHEHTTSSKLRSLLNKRKRA